jgi:hypothetical protein
VWLLHRKIWVTSRGYDERMIYMNDMEIEMIERLRPFHALVDMGVLAGHVFYHLEHYHPYQPRKSSSHRRVNTRPNSAISQYRCNAQDWGLGNYQLDRTWASERGNAAGDVGGVVEFWRVVLIVKVRMAVDAVVLGVWGSVAEAKRWWRRGAIACGVLAQESIVRWPKALVRLWHTRRQPS